MINNTNNINLETQFQPKLGLLETQEREQRFSKVETSNGPKTNVEM